MRSFVLAFVLGTLVLQHASELPQAALLPPAAAALLALVVIPVRLRTARFACWVVPGALAGVGAAAWRAEARLAEALPVAWEGEDLELAGIVAGLPQVMAGGTRFLFEVEAVRTPRAVVPTLLALTWYAERAKGGGDALPAPHIAAGERWRITVGLKRARGPANPHGFDFEAWVRVPALALRIPARKAAVAFGALAALAYSLMTGYQVPAQRTFVMLSVVAVCVLADRHGSPSRVLAWAALAVVALDPWAVLSAGFWLSFGAVASIFYVMALRTGHAGKLRGAVMEQVAVTVAMLPMLMALFQEVSLVSPIANAFAIPLVSLVVVPLTIAGAFLPLPWLLDGAHLLMMAVMAPLEWLAALPVAMLESHEPAAWTVAAAVAGCAWILAPRGVPLRSAGAVWIAPMFAVLPPAPAPGEAWLDVLDVGNGLATVVRTSGHALVYDTGPSWNADADSGSRIVVPFLRGEGVNRLDGVVVSHADDDHSGGAASIAFSREPQWLLSPLEPADVLHGAFAKSMRCEAGARWRLDGVHFIVLHPSAAIYAETRKRKENDRGCVLRLATGALSLLLAADVEARAEAGMLARDREALRSDVMLIPHHGSEHSSTPAFINAVAPAIGLLSVGYRNRFHHPNAGVVARYLERGVILHRTDREGALRITFPAQSGRMISVENQARHARYWSDRRGEP